MTDGLALQEPIDERVEVESVDWLFEPEWPGRRLLARCDGTGVHLTDGAGEVVDDPGFGTALAAVLAVDAAVLEGVWTERGSVDDEGRMRPAFVAVDLLELDGERLLDVPFQERRRLLESILRESTHVRVGPVVKQPLARWFPGWREAGFTHYLARHQNAGYHPGQRSDDWIRIPLDVPASGPGLIQRVTGSRGGRTRRIRD